MALIIKIQANQELIHVYSAQNITGNTSGINNYVIRKHRPSLIPKDESLRIGYLSHTYEDGADILALKVMKLVTNKNKKSHERKSLKESDYVPMSEFMKTDDIP